MKKIFVILFAIFTLTLLFNNKVFCEETTIYTEGNFQYIINDDKDITIVKYNGNDKEVTIPRTIGTYNVTTIEVETFSGSHVREIRLPDSILFVYDTNVESMKVTYYDIFDNDIKTEDSKIVVTPEEKREETSDSSQNTQTGTTTTSQNTEEVSEQEESSIEEIDEDIEMSSNSAYYVSEVEKAPSSNSATILIVSFVVVLIIIAVLIILKKRLVKKTSHN